MEKVKLITTDYEGNGACVGKVFPIENEHEHGVEILVSDLIIGGFTNPEGILPDTSLFFLKKEIEVGGKEKLPFLQLTAIEDVELEEGFIYTAKMKLTRGKCCDMITHHEIRYHEGNIEVYGYCEDSLMYVWVNIGFDEEVVAVGKLCTDGDH